MRFQGRLTEWNDDRGFGFVIPNGGGDRCFVHIKAVASRRRPREGDLITYDVVKDGRGRLNAHRVRLAGEADAPARQGVPSDRGGAFGLVYAAVFCGVVVVLALSGKLSVAVPFAIALVSLLTILAYAFDKAAATRGTRRTPEKTLHLLALLGGWPGAALAQRMFRHKSKKESFQTAFVLTVVLNSAALAWALTPSGAEFLRVLTAGAG